MVDAAEFRQDLYYQINILPIEIPPLGRRREDIPLLVSHFLEQATDAKAGKKLYSPDAIELLATTDWPGNVRQLFELVKQNVAMSHGKIMTKEFVERSLGEGAKKVATYDEARDEFARNYLKINLTSTSGNVSEAARLAKRNRTDFYKLLARYRLEPDDFKAAGQPRRRKGTEARLTPTCNCKGLHMLTVHHLGISQSDRIVWLCEELHIPYELIRYERDPAPGWHRPSIAHCIRSEPLP